MHWFLKFIIGLLGALLIWLLVGYAVPSLLPTQNLANTTLEGLIFRRQVWSGEIHIDGDLITVPGATINIIPGTKVIINQNGDRTNFDYLPWDLRAGLNTGLLWHGVRNGELFRDTSQKIDLHLSKVVALGTAEQPIILTSNSEVNHDSPYDIGRISIDEGILSHLQARNYRRFEIGKDMTVSDSTFNNVVECALCIEAGQPSVIRNLFHASLRQDILVLGASPRITDNRFLGGGKVGVRVDPERFGDPIISYNDFEMPNELALEFVTGDEEHGGVISFNEFAGNTKIKIPCDSKVSLVENDLQGALLTFPLGGCAETLTVGPNYWGTSSSGTVLSERVIKTDQKLKLLVPSLLKSVPPHVGPRT